MVGRQLIVSPIFQSKGKLSTSMLRNLHIRGACTIISDTLQRFGWGGTDPVAATVITLEPDTGAIRGLRYETRGAGPEITFRACELWPAVSEDITLKIKLRDLSILSWVKEGEKRNQTEWLDFDDLEIEIIDSERGHLSKEELLELNAGGLCIRFTLLPVKHNRAFLYGGVVPVSRERLMEMVRELEMEPSSPHIPTITLKLHSVRGKLQNALPLELMPTEQLDNGVGLGIFPLLESIGSRSTKFPEHDSRGQSSPSYCVRSTRPTM